MLGEVLTVLNIAKAVIDIWDRVKPSDRAREAAGVGRALERQAQSAADPRAVVATLEAEAQRQMPPEAAAELVADIRARWILDQLRQDLRRRRGWTVIDEPAFLLAAEKIDHLGSITTGHHLVGFTVRPPTASAVDAEFDRWVAWVKGRSGAPLALLVFVFDNLAGIPLDHILARKASLGWLHGGSVFAGTLDLSRMALDAPKGFLEDFNAAHGAPTFWEAEFADSLEALRRHYIRVSGYFQK